MKAVAVKKPLPPWLQKAKGEGAKEAKSGKTESKAHEKGESKRFEKAEMEGAKKKPAAAASVKTPFGKTTVAKKGYADGGSVSVPIPKLSAPGPARRTERESSKTDDAPKGRNIFDVVKDRGKDLMDAEDRMVKPEKKADGGLVLKKKSQPSAASRSKEGAKRYADGGMVKKGR